MNECIEREKVLECLDAISNDIEDIPECGLPQDYIEGWQDALEAAIDKVKSILAADVRLVTHGKWNEIPGTRIDVLVDFCCSVCGGLTCMSSDLDLEWCGRCGTKMDGKDGESDEQT